MEDILVVKIRQRIASLINLVKTGVFVHPITITYDDEIKELEIDDGWHRMRAFYFLWKVWKVWKVQTVRY
jgi:hypothetical protein